MNTQIQTIIGRLRETLYGEPWYGKSASRIFSEIDSSVTNVRPEQHPHTPTDLIYHMLTWSEFALKRIEGEKIDDMEKFEKLDWREIDPQIHGWEEAVIDFKKTNEQLITALENKDDEWLNTIVDYREYNFRTLLEGLIDHHIYHLAQINYIGKAMG